MAAFRLEVADYDGLQPRADRGAVRQLQRDALPAHGGVGAPHRGLLLSKEGGLSGDVSGKEAVRARFEPLFVDAATVPSGRLFLIFDPSQLARRPSGRVFRPSSWVITMIFELKWVKLDEIGP